MRRTPGDVVAAAQLACLLEAQAPKPGNVSPGRPFGDMAFEDFLASAAAIGAPLLGAGIQPLGATILAAVEATRRWAAANTNLGLILLLAPLVRAALLETDGSTAAPDHPLDGLRAAVARVLDATTVEDARQVYAAIRLAAPGGLGRSDEEDVASEPGRPLIDVMRLAARRDGIAREYATAFDTTFQVGAPTIVRARDAGLSWDMAVVETFLTLLAGAPDTHVARRGGAGLAREVSGRAAHVLAQGGVRTAGGREALAGMDAAVRRPDNSANPGTTADLTGAAIFVALCTVPAVWDIGRPAR